MILGFSSSATLAQHLDYQCWKFWYSRSYLYCLMFQLDKASWCKLCLFFIDYQLKLVTASSILFLFEKKRRCCIIVHWTLWWTWISSCSNAQGEKYSAAFHFFLPLLFEFLLNFHLGPIQTGMSNGRLPEIRFNRLVIAPGVNESPIQVCSLTDAIKLKSVEWSAQF